MPVALTALFVAALAASGLLTAAAARIAGRIGFLDRPAGRKNHARPVPFGGGTAVLATVAGLVGSGMLAAWAATAFPEHSAWLPAGVADHLPGVLRKAPVVWGLLAAAAGLHVVGLIDDARALPPAAKLAAQSAAASAVVFGLDVRATFFVHDYWLTAAASVLWITAVCNSFNFLDNMDGLCAGVAALCGSALLAASLLNGEWFVAALLCVLVGAVAGFLVHNFHPARIFLGDAGSQVIGFLLGCITLLATYYGGRGGPGPDAPVGESAARSAVFIPVVALAVPLYDTASVIVIRLRAGRPIWGADHSHFSHRLRARGLSVRQTVLTVYLCTFATAAGAVFLGRVPMPIALLIPVQTLAILGVLAMLEGANSDAARPPGGPST